MATRAGSIIQSTHETTVTAVEKPECTLKWHTEFGHLNRGDMLTS
ncbi:integrase, partial [Shigella dysenteriae]